ncbi:mitochondrial biogenesis AIM24-domain-containing protein [Triangularia verruculosa]|uniref:Altered inheritance of mitochondria protein 24, mitochondrial n=1 Tax=Triangularia verruculosa TaxID=2587418 RepID=A0AAN6XCT1_9PEZI|nr:mitochondrial biogenesis AIM24-domain-containing protein [Triangularia verruculosa]
MRRQAPLLRLSRSIRTTPRPSFVCWQCRTVSISASPTNRPGPDAFDAGRAAQTDAQFEVIGAPHSLLSVSLSASQRLYTRRGTLASVGGKVENVHSALSILSPTSRAFLGIPFLYQRITSTSPITALIATKSANTTFSILRLDGTTDWMVAQRNALLAWTGHTLRLAPRIQQGLSLAHWGNTYITGRGLAALSAPGQVYEMVLKEGEEIVLHPSHVVAYSINKNPPRPFRLKSTTFTFQIPAVPSSIKAASQRLMPDRVARFWNAMRDTSMYKGLASFLFGLRTATRRTIWGDRLFLHFQGPRTILMSSRGARIRDVLTKDDVMEVADAKAGVVPEAVELATHPRIEEKKAQDKPLKIHIASVKGDGKVSFEDAKSLNEFVR